MASWTCGWRCSLDSRSGALSGQKWLRMTLPGHPRSVNWQGQFSTRLAVGRFHGGGPCSSQAFEQQLLQITEHLFLTQPRQCAQNLVDGGFHEPEETIVVLDLVDEHEAPCVFEFALHGDRIELEL